jgi:hypothetical protein
MKEATWKSGEPKYAATEALQQIRSHIDRLEPGKNQRIREALIDLDASLYAALVVRTGLRTA